MKRRKMVSKWFSIFILMMIAISACTPPVEDVEAEEALAEGQRFVLVSGSKFLMGSEDGEPLSREDEYPQHEVVLSSFFIMKREVTNSEYKSCMDAGICTPPLNEEEGPTALFYDPKFINWPVVGVDWFQAQQFCEWIDATLPTEAQWEKAARGREGGTFPWGEDDPTCELANLIDCEEEKDTIRVLSYPEGESPYKLTEVAGNVREWTADWYAPDTYTQLTSINPSGPEYGELKVTRGGSWNDGPENLRTAARLPLDPHEQSELVGFRCVPVGAPVAPLCQNTYRRFCDPGFSRIPGDEPCEPEENDCGGTSIANFGCPDDGLVTVAFTVPSGGEVDVNIGTDGFDCEVGDGVAYCTGPAQQMGTSVIVTVCGAPPDDTNGGDGEPVTAELNLSSLLIAKTLNPLLRSISEQAALEDYGFCPTGYIKDLETGDCVEEEDRKPCPDGWHPEEQVLEIADEVVLVCVPDGPESCPDGTEYDESLGCIIIDPLAGCPIGFETGAPGDRCAPPVRRLSSCLPGYWMDTELGCCVPFENPCEDEEYFETRTDECLEPQPGGCPECTYLDEYEGCIPIPDCYPDGMGALPGNGDGSGDGSGDGQGPPERTNLPQLPAGMGALQTDCYPDDTDTQGNCDPPPGNNECGEGYVDTYDPQTEELICVPAYGPGSGCPRGYIMDPRTQCCVPLRNPCPNGEVPSTDNVGGANNPFFNVQFGDGNPLFNVVFGDGNFNPYGGDCENSDGDDGDCPPGTYMNDDGGCEDETGGGSTGQQCPEGCWPDLQNPQVCNCVQDDSFQCLGNDCWLADTSAYTCTWTCGNDNGGDYNPCDSDDLVWIPELELCLPRGDDCCPPGYDWSPAEETCLPIIQQGLAMMPNMGAITNGGEGECSEGYEYMDGVCVLASRRGADRCCWTTLVNVPTCIGPCKVGLSYNTTTGTCEKPKQSGGGGYDPCAGCTIGDCGTPGHRCYINNCCWP